MNVKKMKNDLLKKEPKKSYLLLLRDWIKNNFFNSKMSDSRNLASEIEGDFPLSKDQTSMIGNLLELGNVEVSDVMVPRADIVAIPKTLGLNNILDLFIKASHSRMPIFSNDLDNIIGMIHVKDLLPYWRDATDFSISKIKRTVLFASPSMLVSDLLGQMRATRIHMAIVVDEHGGTDGIVTIEDLVEEIVGEIEDEYDTENEPNIEAREDGAFIVNARTKVSELERAMGLSFSKIDLIEDINTIGGLIFTISGRVPGKGEVILDAKTGVCFKVLESDPRRINKVLISRGDLPSVEKVS